MLLHELGPVLSPVPIWNFHRFEPGLNELLPLVCMLPKHRKHAIGFEMYDDHVVLLFDTPMIRELIARIGVFRCLGESDTLPGVGGVSDDVLRDRNRVRMGARACLRIDL